MSGRARQANAGSRRNPGWIRWPEGAHLPLNRAVGVSLRLSRDEGVQSSLFLMSSRIILRKLEPQYCCNESWTYVNLENDTVKLIFWGRFFCQLGGK